MTHPLDTKLAIRNAAIRKGLAFALIAYRQIRYPFVTPESYLRNPPIIVNSIPKSGTHLLLQIARSLPDTHYYGAFINWASSVTLIRRSQSQIDRMVRRMIPGEVAGAHLHYSEYTSKVLLQQNVAHWLIVRDPVDIVLSEVHYLRHMNWHHRMAREFRHLSEQAAIELCLDGSQKSPGLFPPFDDRLRPYLSWLDQPAVTLVRYEDLLRAETRHSTIQRIVAAWRHQHAGLRPADYDLTVARAEQAIAPERSHTYSGRKQHEDQAIRATLASRLVTIRQQLGYPISPG